MDYDAVAIDGLFVDLWLEAHAVPAEEVILDLDTTDVALHGHQEGRFFHGYYNYCYLPLYIFCGEHLLSGWVKSTPGLPLAPYTSQRRNELLSLYTQLQKRVQELDRQVEEQAQQRPQALRLLMHPGVGPVDGIGDRGVPGRPSRFSDGKAVASYIGMIPCEHSSGKRQRLGKLTKQGNTLLRYLWTEATIHAVRKDAELKRFYRRKLIQKGQGKGRSCA